MILKSWHQDLSNEQACYERSNFTQCRISMIFCSSYIDSIFVERLTLTSIVFLNFKVVVVVGLFSSVFDMIDIHS